MSRLRRNRPHRPGDPLVGRARTYVQENYPLPLSVAVVASQLRVSPHYLSRVFRKETGSSLTSYIHRVRVEHALLMLASGGRSVSEAAQLVGYASYREFYRSFLSNVSARAG